MKDKYNDAKNNSVNKMKIYIQRTEKKVRIAFFKLVLIMITTISLLVAGNLIARESALDYYTVAYQEIVDNNSHLTNNYEYKWYDNGGIAFDLKKNSKEEVSDEDIFGVYSAMKHNKVANMDEVLKYVGYSKGFENYVIGLGFEKDGEADFKKYDTIMGNYFIAKNRVDEQKDEVNR